MSSSLIKAFKIVDYIKENPECNRLADISAGTSLNKTTVFRYLESLVSLNLIEKRDECYFLGLGFLYYSSGLDLWKSVKSCVHPLLAELSDQVRETVNIAVLYDSRALYLDKAESARSLAMRSSVGDVLPLHSTAIGKAVLSVSSNEFVEEYIKKGLKKYTENTITDEKILRDQILHIKESGISIENEEFEEGLTCIAVPLVIKEYSFKGGLSVSAPCSRFTEEKRLEVRDSLVEFRNRMKDKILKGGKND